MVFSDIYLYNLVVNTQALQSIFLALLIISRVDVKDRCSMFF